VRLRTAQLQQGAGWAQTPLRLTNVGACCVLTLHAHWHMIMIDSIPFSTGRAPPSLTFYSPRARAINKVRNVAQRVHTPPPLPIPWELPYSFNNYCDCQTWESWKNTINQRTEKREFLPTSLIPPVSAAFPNAVKYRPLLLPSSLARQPRTLSTTRNDRLEKRTVSGFP
jgi:hypothetical protein